MKRCSIRFSQPLDRSLIQDHLVSSLSSSSLMTEAGTLTTALVVETAALVPTFAPLTAVPTVVLATVTHPERSNEIKIRITRGLMRILFI